MVESTGLENRQGGNSFVGSNPTPSATEFIGFFAFFFLLKFLLKLSGKFPKCTICVPVEGHDLGT